MCPVRWDLDGMARLVWDNVQAAEVVGGGTPLPPLGFFVDGGDWGGGPGPPRRRVRDPSLPSERGPQTPSPHPFPSHTSLRMAERISGPGHTSIITDIALHVCGCCFRIPLRNWFCICLPWVLPTVFFCVFYLWVSYRWVLISRERCF